MTKPQFSIIIPVYNASKTIAATVRSVLEQTIRDIEIIMIDDGSTDESLAEMLTLAAGDQRIKALSQTNMGVAATRNYGVHISRAPLIAFLDADDLWHPQKLERHAAYHDSHPRVAASYARISFVSASGSGQMHTTSKILPASLKVSDLLSENPVCTMSNFVVTRQCFDSVGGFRANMSFAEDQEWLARAASQFNAIEGIDEVLVDYRLSQDGLSVNLERMYAGWRDLATVYYKLDELSAAEAVYCRYLSRRALRSGALPSQAISYALRGLRLNSAAFLNDAKRGWLTLLSALAAPLLPRSARMRVFA